MALEFDTIAYEVNANNFGAPADVDGNSRVVLFFTRAVNELSPPASSSVITGYFAARDLFDASPDGCAQSNAGEILYSQVPDITGSINSNVRQVSFVRGAVRVVMVHELQHLINASRRMYVQNASSFEEVWLNEGLSSVAEELAFYRTSGMSPRSGITVSALQSPPNAARKVSAFNTYANPNFTRLRGWLQRPDTSGAFKTSDALAMRGAIWAFLRYAADRHGGSEAAFWSSLVNTQVSGRANLQAVIGAEPEAWLRDFTVAIYADHAVTGLAAEHTTPSWNFRNMYTTLTPFPYTPRALTSGTPLTVSYSRGGGSAYIRFGVNASSVANLSISSGGAAAPSATGVMLLRTR
jgi:hypothetical protein